MRRILILLACTSLALAGSPRGWEFSSAVPDRYLTLVDAEGPHAGRSCGSLKSVGTVERGAFATLGQKLSAGSYRGWRVRLTGYLRTRDVSGWAGLWLRVDPRQGAPLRFENMQRSPVTGTTAWTLYSLEMDIPPEGWEVHFGMLLSGAGQVWLDDVSLERLHPILPGSEERARARGAEVANPGFEEP